MDNEYYVWIELHRSCSEYVRGTKNILKNAFPVYKIGDEMKFPCKKCSKRYWCSEQIIYDHLVCNGPSQLHIEWICEVFKTKLGDTDDFMESEERMDFPDNLDAMFSCTGKKF